MLYTDSPKRISEIESLVKLFEDKGYKLTAKRLDSFKDILKQSKVPADFLKRLDDLFSLFENEFADSMPIGKIYRKQCFAEVKGLLFKAIGRLQSSFAKAIMEIYPSLVSLNHGRHIAGDIADGLEAMKNQNKKLAFHLYCYAYLVTVEGIFDEVARILYFLKTVDKNNIPKAGELKKMDVWKVLDSFSPRPVFLNNWEEKQNIRNAIGHCNVYYNVLKDEVRFVNERNDYDETKSLTQFMKIALELDSTVAAYTYIMLLLKVYDFIVSPTPFV